jgi:single-strand DNA-binding protein
MNQGLNKVLLIGYLCSDPEMRFTPSGRPITTFSIVVSRDNAGIDRKVHMQSELFSVLVWSELAEICKDSLKRGQRVYVDGRLQTRHWVDDQGNSKSNVEIIANELLILSDVHNEEILTN